MGESKEKENDEKAGVFGGGGGGGGIKPVARGWFLTSAERDAIALEQPSSASSVCFPWPQP